MSDLDRPVHVNEIRKVRIVSVGAQGDGISFVNRFAIFVPDAKVGEEMKVKVIKTYPKFAIAERLK